MHIICDKITLAAALSLVQRAVAAKSPLPTLKGMLLETKENGLILSATDLEFGIRCHINTEVVEHGSIVLPAKLLTEFVRKLPDDKITIKSHADKDLHINLACQNIRIDISGFSADEFPRLPNINPDAQKLQLSEGLLKEMLTQTEVAVARDEIRPVLTGLLLEKETDKIKFVGTDGHRLAYRQASIDTGSDLKLILPRKSIQEIIKIVEDDFDKELSIFVDGTDIIFDLGDVMVFTRVVEGKYPPYQQIIPTDFKTSVVAETQDILEALERAEIIVRDGENLVRWVVGEDGLKIFAVNQDVGSAEDFVPGQVNGEELEIRFNVRLLLDCFRNIKANQVNMDFTSSFSPCMIRPMGDHNYLHLVLPVRVS